MRDSDGRWTKYGWISAPETSIAEKRMLDRMECAVDLAHKAVDTLTRQIVGLATDGADTPSEMARWYYSCLLEAMTQIGLMSGGITIAAAKTLATVVTDNDEKEKAKVIKTLLDYVDSNRAKYGDALIKRIGKGDPTEFQESLVVFLKMAGMWKEEDGDGHKKS